MNFTKNKTLILRFSLILPISGLVSCDSGDSSPPLQTSEAVLNSTAPSESEVLAGDRIAYIATDGTFTPFLSSLTFAGNSTTRGESQYEYSKTGDLTFNLQVSFSAPESLDTAFTQLINGDLGNPLSTRLRSILQRALPEDGGPPFTPEELQFMVRELNAGGANIQINDTNNGLRVPTNQTYRHQVSTSVRERNRGTLGGVYVLESSGSEIIFRPVTPSEAANFRFFSDGLIPVVSTETFVDNTDEIGTFNIQFINPSS